MARNLTTRPELGAWGEQMAGWFLVRQGLEVTGTNVTVDSGEIDIVARDRHEKVAVEVRTRRGDLAEVIAADRSKLGRMRRNGLAVGATRIDLVVVAVGEWGVRMQWSRDV